MDTIKQQLYQYCLEYVNTRIETAKNAIASAQDAAVNDTKSSAGDKYETTREMMQQEIARNQAQLMEAGKLKHLLSQISTIDNHSGIVKDGNIVVTDEGHFFIAISAGQTVVNEQEYYTISSFSPLGKALLGKQINDIIEFNKRKFLIMDII